MKFDLVCFCAGVSVGAFLVATLGNAIFYFAEKLLAKEKK